MVAFSYHCRMSPRSILAVLVGILGIMVTGSVLDVMEVDAAQYAGMARDMLHEADWKQLHFRGNDYLDKPPLLFWLSALSFKLFGIHNWSYKLPSILFALLGLYGTYRFARLHHGEAIAVRAALMLGTSAAFLIMTNDVRCDTVLMGAVITAIWLGSAWMQERHGWQLIGCSVAIAAGMLAKGPIGLMAPVLALGGDLVLRRRWVLLRDARLLLVPALLAVLLLPMAIGLYQQHGWHGLRFYLWEQSFGRITGENRWKDDSSMLFFTHELLWQLLPWTPFVLLGLWNAFRAIARRQALAEYVSLSGVVLVFIALSLSHFKLPHYLYVIVPLFAVLGAQAWEASGARTTRQVEVVVMILLFGIQLFLVGYCFPEGGLPFIIVTAIMLLLYLRTAWRGRKDLFVMTALGWCVIALGVNLHLYPILLGYQANAQAGRWAADQGLGQDHFYGMQVSGTALDFYAGYPVRWLSDAEEAASVIRQGVTIYTDSAHYHELLNADLIPDDVNVLPQYEVQLLGIDFILPAHRERAIQQRYLLRY